MSTSLAEQLKRLQLPQTSLLQEDKERASLLFDPKEAATYKREFVFQSGIDGLEELILKNHVFDQFRNTLFDITSKQVQRSVQNKEFNEKLDKEIKRFLILLSPYFLLEPAHKALEWLIRRFNINEYNRDDILMLILPYHESNIFVRALKLLKFSDSNDDFVFLKSLQKPSLHLTKSALLNHAATSPFFLKFVSDFVLSAIKIHEKPAQLTVIFNFYCTVFTGALEYSENVSESQVSHMLPSLLKGLDSNIPDFCASTYVILARLTARTELTEKVLTKFVVKISRVKVDNLRTEAVLVLLIIYQSQKHYMQLPQEAVKNFAQGRWMIKMLQDLNAKGSYVYPFLEQVIKSTISAGASTNEDVYKEFMKDIVSHMVLDHFFVSNFISLILDSVKLKTQDKQAYREWLRDTLQSLERQYPNPFDKEVYKILSDTADNELQDKRKYLKILLKESMQTKAKFDIFEKLHHPSAQIRMEAMKHISKEFGSLKSSDQDMIKSSFIDRLNDDNLDVVKGALDVVKTLPLDVAELNKILKSLAFKCEKVSGFKKLSGRVIKGLCAVAKNNDWDVLGIIYSYLLTHSIKDVKKVLEGIRDSPFATKNSLFKVDELVSLDSSDSIITTFINSMNRNTNSSILEELYQAINTTQIDEDDVFYKYLMAFILSNVLPQSNNVASSCLITNLFLDWFNSSPRKKISNTVEDSHNASVHEKSKLYLDTAKEGKLHPLGFLDCLQNIFLKTNIPDTAITGGFDFSENNQVVDFFITVSNIVFANYKHCKSYSASFLDKFWKTPQKQIEFVLDISISENSKLDSKTTENMVKTLADIVNTKDSQTFLSYDSFVTPYVLILLCSNKEYIRLHVMKLLTFIVDSTDEKSDTYWFLLAGLKKYTQEILLDGEQLPVIMYNLLSPENTDGNIRNANRTLNTLVQVCCNQKSPVYLQSGILQLLSVINSIELFEKTATRALKLLETKKKDFTTHESIIIDKNILRFDSQIAKRLKLGDTVWKFIEAALENDTSELIVDDKKLCPSILVLNQIDKTFFPDIKTDVQMRILDSVVEITTTTQNPLISPVASQVFKHMDLDCELVLDHLVKMRDIQSFKQVQGTRKRRVSVLPTLDILDTLEWKKGVTILEFIQGKKKLQNTELLLPLCFEVLKKCLEFDEQVAVEYPKQLLLSSILNCCSKLRERSLPESVFNMELVVQCIRASQNPQTHHHALLVLAKTAAIYPNQVLHHIMAIFTFMGSSFVRHDDAYSFQILTNIIDEIIPILVDDGSPTKICQVLRVFVDVILDVPEHRRLPLYKHLLTKIHAKENLHLFLLLVFESHVIHIDRNSNTSEDVVPRILDIAANLCREFSPDVVIYSCIKLIKYLNGLPVENDNRDNQVIKQDPVTFNIQKYTPKQFRHYKYTLILFTANLLSSKEFVSQVAVLSENDFLNMEMLYKDMIINILTYIQRTTKISEHNFNTPQSQYWKIILHHSHDILDSINALLTPQMFLLVIKGLMVHNIGMVCRRALELLNSKLQYNANFFSDCEDMDIFALIPPLMSIIETINNEPDNEQQIIIQTALLSLKLLVKLKGEKNVLEFKKILEFIVTLLKSGKAKENVLASVILCLAELCANLGAHAIPCLPHYMPSLLKVLKRQNKQEVPSLLLVSILTALHKILECLSLFMSPYLVKILCELCLLMSKYGTESDDQKVHPVVTKLASIKERIGAVIPFRVLIPAIEESYVTLSEKNCFNSVGSLMDIFTEALKNLDGSDFNLYKSELEKFFLTALQFRTDDRASLEETNNVENHIVKALTTLVLKLSESTFKPFYYKLYDWAYDREEKTEKVITFYNFSSEISENLKGLFVLFAGHFITHAAETLDALNAIKNNELYFTSEAKNLLLLENILKTLRNTFMYDSSKFVNKGRFDILMQPLVDQLENNLGGVDKLKERCTELVIPCIVAFAVAVGDDSLWKQANYQILLKMRHSSAHIRVIALNCLTEVVKKIGDEFLPLLPETIPFLSELLEDDQEQVEKAAAKSVQDMEKVLGESLQKYF